MIHKTYQPLGILFAFTLTALRKGEAFSICQNSCKLENFIYKRRSRHVLATLPDESPEVLINTIAPSTPSLADALNEIYVEEIKPKKKTGKPKKRTKGQIKKLKFLMNTDVEKLIQENNSTAIEKAEDNIQRLQKLYDTEQNPDYKPKILNYNMIVRAYGKSNLPDAPEQAVRVLNQLKDMYHETGDEDIRPTTITYTECIDSYAKSNKKDAAKKAEELLFLMMEESENEDGTTDERFSPSSITCDVVLNAWARTRTVEGATRAEQILERMEYLRTTGNVKIQPTSYSFATVISAWAKARPDRENKTANAKRAQFILLRMNDFRKRMSKSSEEDQAYAKQLYPDAVVYNSVLDAWARSKDPIAGTRAEELLLEMEELQKQDGKLAPDTITYNSIINCHANSAHINAAKKAETILTKMEQAKRKEGRNVSPNTLTYNQVLKTYSKSNRKGAAQRADMILRYMLRSDNEDIQPDVISFSTCLDVWAKSKEPGKAEKAYTILQKMIEFHEMKGSSSQIKPNHVTYNTVLNACAFSAFTEEQEKKQALRIAVNLFNEMQKSDVEPDAITYGMMIKCIANLMPRGQVRNRMASDLFTKAKDKGLVNGLVFDEIRRAVPGNIMSDLLKDCFRNKKRKPLSEMVLRDLPRSWKVNVVEARPKRKRSKKKKEESPSEAETSKPTPIRPMRRIVESSWQSGRDV